METRKIVLWQSISNRGTDKAHLFKTLPGRDERSRSIWIPRSITHHVSRDPVYPNEVEQRCTVEVEEWFLEKNHL